MSIQKRKEIIVIVSAYSSGAMLPKLFSGRGYACVHVTTRREWDIKRLRAYFDERVFINNIILDDEDPIFDGHRCSKGSLNLFPS